MKTFDTADFFAQLYKHAENKKDDEATDLIFESADHLFRTREFSGWDHVIKTVDLSGLSTSVMRSLLCASSWAREFLPSYDNLYQRIEPLMIGIRGEEIAKRVIGVFK
jgi:hypothetical protein